MAEVGLGKGAGVGSFAAGFGKGLSQALLYNRERSDEKSKEERARKDRLFQTMLPVYLQNAEDVSDLQPLLESQFPEIFTQAKKGGKTGQTPFEKISGFLAPIIGMNKRPLGNDLPQQGGITGTLPRTPMGTGSGMLGMAPSQQPEGVSGGTLGNQPTYALPQPINAAPGGQALPQPFDAAPDISQTALGGAAPPPAAPEQPAQRPRRTLFGVPMLTDEERAQRAGNAAGIAEGAKTEAELNAKVAAARRMVDTGAAANLGEALDRLGLREQTGRATEPFQSVPGEDAQGNPTFGVFDQTRGMYLSPITHEPIAGFRPKTTSGAAASEFESFLVSYAKEHNKTVDQLSAKERLDARSEYAKAGSTAQPKTEQDPTALARLAVRQPQVLQSMTPTNAGQVMAAIAADPQLSAQYEFGRMQPIRSQAQSAIDAMKDLVIVDPKTGQVKGLTPGAAGLYGVGPGRLARFVPGSQTATAKAALDQITGTLTLDMLKDMKAQSRTGATGFGQLSGRELDVLQSAATVLRGEVSPERALQELKKLYDRFNKVLLPGDNEMVASAGQQSVGPITLDTPIFIGPGGKPSLTPVK